jgi:hypothetical protein
MNWGVGGSFFTIAPPWTESYALVQILDSFTVFSLVTGVLLYVLYYCIRLLSTSMHMHLSIYWYRIYISTVSICCCVH